METALPFERIERKSLIRNDCKTYEKYGTYPDNVSTENLLDCSIINIDKPKGPTSHQVSAYVQQILGIKKSGHSGTLDPGVTGMLPIAIGRGTRIVQLLLTAGKEYITLMHLHKMIEQELVRNVMRTFVGKIRQLPPIKSAIKREWRYRKVYYIEILEIDGQDVLFRIGCQAGTYIRKICHDIGAKLGCGAHMAELKRTKTGPFTENMCHTLNDLKDAYWYYRNSNNDTYLRRILLPIETAVDHLPKVWVMDTTVDTLCHGASLAAPGIAKVHSDIQVGEYVAIMTLKGELIGYGTSKMTSNEMVKKEKGIAVSTGKVFMLPGIYPRVDKRKERL